ncbi:hypothetical protein [Microcystis aeruginosa]|uniref:Uncharacterized protein n=1 Tax=Microcystis aeruginosa FD4 TaxID=2686288 RepID=A0A857D1W4_MICAE|nr:hypothetical protein [Microcystis aeruginosa]QGZ89644.1 hypothetical protein GQR42_08795 [Microcystis aeruginosa FD4]
MFFVNFTTFFGKINYFSGICLSFLAIRSRETGGRSRETGVRRQEIISIYSSDTPHPTPYTLHPTPHTPHPTPHTPHPTPCPQEKLFAANPIINPNLAKAAGQQAAQNQWPLSLLIS